MDRLTIGTRGSKLALAQTQLVIDALKKNYPGLDIATKIITTKGDVNQAPIPLDTIGKAWFTEEIEQALLNHEIDLAIHSLKDLPPELPEGLIVLPVLERADARDVLVAKSKLKELRQGVIIGTDSIRRKALLLAERGDLIVKSIRGNVDTRLKKFEDGDYDAIVIAAAGLARLGLADRITEFFDATTFIPAPGQGILAAEIRKDNPEILEMLRSIEHLATTLAATAEQAFSRVVGGGCKLPIGCYSNIEGDVQARGSRIFIYAMIGDEKGERIERRSIDGPVENAVQLAEDLARQFSQYQ